MAGVFSESLYNLALFFCWPLQCQILGIQSFPFKIIDICYCFLADSISEEKLYACFEFVFYCIQCVFLVRHVYIFSLSFKLKNVTRLFLVVISSLIFLSVG